MEMYGECIIYDDWLQYREWDLLSENQDFKNYLSDKIINLVKDNIEQNYYIDVDSIYKILDDEFWINHPSLNKFVLAPRMYGDPDIKHFLMIILEDLLLDKRLELYNGNKQKVDIGVPRSSNWEEANHWFKLIHPNFCHNTYITIPHSTENFVKLMGEVLGRYGHKYTGINIASAFAQEYF